MLEVLAQKPYSWTLLRDDNEYIFSVAGSGRSFISYEVRLITREIQLYEAYGEEILDDLARQVAQSPGMFKSRMIENFEQDERVSEAYALWHKQKATN
ncbi:hypothetical protein [Pseudoalteromonas luteoviolacea]|uniref:Uncharacterized protein n=1 Tax=Pseudoalteromonas luteoviolacea DSM 6061 TaxID=1365250 RepID=A0A166XW60_9GAMM|nr:hypothetical protein [Pseudoalteromonas luteoviolacea]KZN40973.1 hypothetical protein N475_00935 [Pseudoalteromonas luteoviolacea DSM 6061]KZN56403.1 hypothetical protein N474_11700 [Pseudoalteromonas luteoviolacea CPMOR-2]MBE0386307.1 hypothetical protein [Pseudoalteromonas luteoviolacea DSM 6061]TQF71188.1 hypothetical protein FLM44_08890 [Pseudoalteromonas luteoviolacea]